MQRSPYPTPFTRPQYFLTTRRSGSRPGASASRRAWKPGGGERSGWVQWGVGGSVSPECELDLRFDELRNISPAKFKQNMRY